MEPEKHNSPPEKGRVHSGNSFFRNIKAYPGHDIWTSAATAGSKAFGALGALILIRIVSHLTYSVQNVDYLATRTVSERISPMARELIYRSAACSPAATDDRTILTGHSPHLASPGLILQHNL